MSKHRKPCGCVTEFHMVNGVIKFKGYFMTCEEHQKKKKKKKNGSYTKKGVNK